MAWALNQIWLGDDPPLEALKATQEQAKEFGWDYRFWTWGSLTSTFGFYYFQNFILSKLPPRALTFLTKFYLWLVLEQCGDHGMFLDATASLPLSSYSPEVHFTLPGVYVASDYSPSFLALSHASAARIGREAVVEELKLRHKANGDYMFTFFSTLTYNILGSRYLSTTLIPRWKRVGVKVFNNPEAEMTSPQRPLPPSYLLPSPLQVASSLPSPSPAPVSTSEPEMKVSSLEANIPNGCSRVLIIGDSVMGITDVEVYARKEDLLIHLDACPFFHAASSAPGAKHAVFYRQISNVPLDIQGMRDKLFSFRALIPGVTFRGYAWTQGQDLGRISPQVALACSYREENPFLPITIYGHNTADDVIYGYDTEAESSLLQFHNISLTPPKYDLLFLILSRRGNSLRRALFSKYWAPKLVGTKHTYRFICASGKSGENLWVLPHAGEDEDDSDVGLKVYTALAHARHMRAKYYFLMLDDTYVDPSRLWDYLRVSSPVTFGRRFYDGENKVLAYNLGPGIGLSYDALEQILGILTAESVVQLRSRPDILLAQAIKATKLTTVDTTSELFRLDFESGDLPMPGNNLISCAGVKDDDFRRMG